MRTRGGDPTLTCRSEPPDSTRARRYGSTDRADVARVERSGIPKETEPTDVRLTGISSTRGGQVLTVTPNGLARECREEEPSGSSSKRSSRNGLATIRDQGATAGGLMIRQALGRLPWFAPLPLRARRLRVRLLMSTPQIRERPMVPHAGTAGEI